MIETGDDAASLSVLDAHVALIVASGLLDGDWYRERYADLPADIDPARHYLAYGALEERDPGPAFSTGWYLAAYPDVAASGTNPLVHYLHNGRAEHRVAQPVAAIHSRSLARDTQELRASGIFDAEWYHARYPDVATMGVDPLAHYLGVGWREGHDPSPAISTRAWLASRPGIDERRMHPMLRYVRDRAAGVDVRPRARLMLGTVELGLCLPDAPAAAAVAGFAALHRGLAVKVRLKQPGGATQTLAAVDVAPHCLGLGGTIGDASRAEAIRVVDGWWTTDRDMRLRVEGDGDIVLRAFQLSDDSTVDEQDLGPVGPLGFVDLRVRPLAPILLVTSGPSGDLAAAVLPFPSLLRGGPHAAEGRGLPAMQASHAASHARTDGARVRTLCIEGRANGSETIFRDSVAVWLATVFAVEIVATGTRTTGGALRLPPDALPTIAVLCARGEVAAGTALGDVIVVGPASSGRACRLSMPAQATVLSALQPADAVPLPRIDRMTTTAPLALRFPAEVRGGDAPLLTPRALDAQGSTLGVPLVDLAAAGGMTVVIDCRARADASALVASLAAQDGAEALDIVVLGTIDRRCADLLAARFPERYRSIAPATDWASAIDAIALDGRAVVLAIDAAMRLHDPRGALTLATLALRPDVATVGCVAIRETAGAKGSRLAPVGAAYALDHVVALPRPGVAITSGPVTAFLGATMPVVANARRVFAVARDTIVALGGLSAREAGLPAEIAFGLRAVEAGLLNLCTGAITASTDAIGPDAYDDRLTHPSVDLARALSLRSRITNVCEV